MTEKLVDYRENNGPNTIISVTIWEIPESKDFPEGIKYKLQAFNTQTGNTILRYDNHNDAHGARHHKHIGEHTQQIKNPFKNADEDQVSSSIMRLIEKFEKEVEELK